LKKLGQHPKFGSTPGHVEKIERILRGFGTVVDSINQIPKSCSLAHANENLLDEADAMLVVNAARTILRYVDDRLR